MGTVTLGDIMMIDPSTAEGQKAMQRNADQRILGVCKAFNEVQTGPNPLTADEVRHLIEKRPEVYGVLEAWASKGTE